MSENSNEETTHQDPAEQYRTDTAVETTEQPDPTDELEQADKSDDILHSADTGVHTNL